MGAAISTRIAPRRATQVPSRRTERAPRSATGTTGTPARAAATKAPLRKGRSPARRVERAFGENDQRRAAPDRLDQHVGMLDASGDIEALDEDRAVGRGEPAQALARQLALGDEDLAAIVEHRDDHAIASR